MSFRGGRVSEPVIFVMTRWRLLLNRLLRRFGFAALLKNIPKFGNDHRCFPLAGHRRRLYGFPFAWLPDGPRAFPLGRVFDLSSPSEWLSERGGFLFLFDFLLFPMPCFFDSCGARRAAR